jgi:hypothetical protein
MTSYQHAKRVALWRGSLIAIAALSFLMVLSALADRITQ